MTVSDAAKSGDHLELLMSIRDRLLDEIRNDDCPARDLASLARRLQDVMKEIAEIDPDTTVERLDALKVLRIRMAATISSKIPPYALAALTRRLQDVAKEISELEERARLEGKSRNSGSTGKPTRDRYDETGG